MPKYEISAIRRRSNMHKAFGGKQVNDIEAAIESIPDGLAFSGTSLRRVGSGKKAPVQNMTENPQPDSDRDSRN